MKKFGIIWCLGCLCGAMVSATVLAQDAAVSTVEEGSPVYAEPDSEPMRTAPSTPRVRLHSPQIQAGSEITGLPVFTETDQTVGVVEDLIVNFAEGRIAYVLVAPAADFGAGSNFSYALAPRTLAIDGAERRLVVELSESQIRRAQPISLSELMVLAELSDEKRRAVYRVGVVRPFPAEPYVLLPRPPINGYVAPGPHYAEPWGVFDFDGSYPPEYRGGYPPEYRGGYPPQYRGTLDLDPEDREDRERPGVYGGRDRTVD